MYQPIGSKYMPAGTVWKFLLRSSRPPWASQDRTQQARGIDHHWGACSRCAGPHDCPFGSKQRNYDHVTVTLYPRSSMIELQPCMVSKLRFCPLCEISTENLKTESPSNFNWTSQLRFELRESQEELSLLISKFDFAESILFIYRISLFICTLDILRL